MTTAIRRRSPARGSLEPRAPLRASPRRRAEHGFEQRAGAAELAEADEGSPERLQLFPGGAVAEARETALPGGVMRAGADDGSPAVEFFIGPPVARFELLFRQAARLIHDVPRIVEIPIVRADAPFGLHAGVEGGAGVRSQDVEGRGGDAASIAQSTVRRKTSGSSASRPKTKLPLILMPRSSRRRVTAR